MQVNTNRKPVRGAVATMLCAATGTLFFFGATQSSAQTPGASSASAVPAPTLVIPPLSPAAPPANPTTTPSTTKPEKAKKPAIKPAASLSTKQKPVTSGTTTRYINLNN